MPETSETSLYPPPLTYAESVDLRRRIEHAIDGAQAAFIAAHVACDARGTPINGPDPRAVFAETVFTLARMLARAGLDLTDARVPEAHLARLEAELEARDTTARCKLTTDADTEAARRRQPSQPIESYWPLRDD